MTVQEDYEPASMAGLQVELAEVTLDGATGTEYQSRMTKVLSAVATFLEDAGGTALHLEVVIDSDDPTKVTVYANGACSKDVHLVLFGLP